MAKGEVNSWNDWASKYRNVMTAASRAERKFVTD